MPSIHCEYCLLTDLVYLSLILFRLFGITAIIQTNETEPYSLGLQPDISWPVFTNPMVLLLLYYTLVALLHKWVNITEEEEVL